MTIGEVIFDVVFGFKTPHIVHVRNFKIGLIHRLVQLLIFAYVIGVAIIYKKGYQETDNAEGTVTTKVKGVASTLNRTELPKEYQRVWDTVDYVIPPQENGAFFVMTDAIVNEPQRFGTCPEMPSLAPCNSSADCPVGEITKGGTGNGVMTGRCVGRSCEITAWCPVEKKDPPTSNEKPLLPEVYNFTVMIKNSVSFQKFKRQKRNVPEDADGQYFACRYNSETETRCPIFQIGYMIQKAGGNFSAMAKNGSVINIIIEWNCNLDVDFDLCFPQFTFAMMESGMGSGVGTGWNFRYASHYRDSNDTLTREVIKAYGILFVFTIRGHAGKFSFIPLLLNIGAGAALLGVATLICDFLLLHCFKQRALYKDYKFQIVDHEKSESPRTTSASPYAITTEDSTATRRQSRVPSAATATSNGNGNGTSSTTAKGHVRRPRSVGSAAQNGTTAANHAKSRARRERDEKKDDNV